MPSQHPYSQDPSFSAFEYIVICSNNPGIAREESRGESGWKEREAGADLRLHSSRKTRYTLPDLPTAARMLNPQALVTSR